MSEQENVQENEQEDQGQDLASVVADLQSQNSSMQSKMNELLNEAKQAKNSAREAEAAKQAAELEKAQKAGDFEQLLKSSEQQRAELAQRYEGLRTTVAQKEIDAKAMELAAQLADGNNAKLLKAFIAPRLKYTEDGLKVTDLSGNLTVSTFDDLVREYQADDTYNGLKRGSKSSGGGATGSSNNTGGAGNLTRSQHNQLTPAQKMEFAQAGRKIIDD